MMLIRAQYRASFMATQIPGELPVQIPMEAGWGLTSAPVSRWPTDHSLGGQGTVSGPRAVPTSAGSDYPSRQSACHLHPPGICT